MESGKTMADILCTDVAVSETARRADQKMQVVTGKNVVNALLGATCHSSTHLSSLNVLRTRVCENRGDFGARQTSSLNERDMTRRKEL